MVSTTKRNLVARITEQSLYGDLKQVLELHGAVDVVPEIKYDSEIDISFEFFGIKWLLSVKIGESPTILRRAFLQYDRHREESGFTHGLILFFPEEIRKIKPSQQDVTKAVNEKKCTCLILAPGQYRKDWTSVTFPQVVFKLEQEVIPALKRGEISAFSLESTITLLRDQISEMMLDIRLGEEDVMRITTDPRLFSGIAHLDENQSSGTARFLASYIILSQILFLRLFSRNRPNILPQSKVINRRWLRKAFNNILDINYKPIFELDVINEIPEDYLIETRRLIWALEVEGLRDELPGRLFHELIPSKMRKMLAAFYTRPQAAKLLARLTITRSSDSVFDPSCGSGTILVSAYRRKMDLHFEERLSENPHKRFCEQEIFGSDIMTFAVHLTTANLASMDSSVTLNKTQIIHRDSLALSEGYVSPTGIQLTLFEPERKAYDMAGIPYDVKLHKVDVILMNPPFTKVERGVGKLVDMSRFGEICGNEVGLWGHFIALADHFLNDNGIFGGVIPISVLRGKETKKIRDFIFTNWTPMYIIKSTFNYGFSESSEYRDILFIARKMKPRREDVVKFVLIKKDLDLLSDSEITHIANQIEVMDKLSSDKLDIESFSFDELHGRLENMMWFCGTSSASNRSSLVSFIEKSTRDLKKLPVQNFRTGYRPAPGGVSSFMFLTRASNPFRTEEAFLSFNASDEHEKSIVALSKFGNEHKVEKAALLKSLRTAVGIKTLDITHDLDYVAFCPYKELDNVINASGFTKPARFMWKNFWSHVSMELDDCKTKIATLCRINPYSSNTNLLAFCSRADFSPSDILNVILEKETDAAKAQCVLINSIIFLSQFFLLKEETTGRYIHLRLYDYEQILIFPVENKLTGLAAIFDKYAHIEFPSLRLQFDTEFDIRYNNFWLENKTEQKTLFEMNQLVTPSNIRLEFDMAVCKALGIHVSEKKLREIYTVIINEMIITRGLKR